MINVSNTYQMIVRIANLPIIERRRLTPTTKKTPANKASGIRFRTTSRGPVMVPMIARPIRKWETRCSTTRSATRSCCRISARSAVLIILSSLRYSVKESVCTGACGMSPFGSGIPMIPAMKLVQPRRKKSQWKPPGFFKGKFRAWAATLL